VDGRGTTGRSRAFHEFSYRNLGGAFEDHVAMIKQMAAHLSYMDATRVGIYGTSAGGYGAAHAMLVFPEFYKVGVTTSGDHDARLDKAWWNELYQGYPVQDDYVAQSNVTLAGHLAGHYLVRRRWDYFVQYLLGVAPPENFEIHEDQTQPGRRR
jgi:dipeptidyl-peptidase-4